MPATERTPSNPYLSHVSERDVTTPSGRRLTLMNPAYMLRQIMDDYSEDYGITGHITSLNPLRRENSPDEWETSALESFAIGVEETVEFTHINGRPYLRLMRPMVTREGCIECHGHQGYKVGDIRGGVSVSVPLDEYMAIDQQEFRALMLTHGLLWLLGLFAVGFGSVHLSRNERMRLQSEKELEESRKFLQSVIDGIAEPILLIGSDYSVKLLNLAAMGDKDYTALTEPRKCYELGHDRDTPCDGEEHPCPLDQVSLAGKSVTVVHKHTDNEGKDRYVDILASPLYSEDGSIEGIIEVRRDITKRITAERHLIRSLGERELLIKEINHRAKNNLMVVQSLLKLQSNKARYKADKEMFAESENRVRAMGMIHDRLYRSGDLSTIDMPEYINSLASILFKNYRQDDSKVKLRVHTDDMKMDIDTIIPCGLILNELLSNALKYAFPKGRKGMLEVSLTDNGDKTCTMNIKDNGIGLPEGLDIYNTDTLGMQIVTSLCQQIEASLEVSNDGGASFIITFSIKGSKQKKDGPSPHEGSPTNEA